MVDDAAQPWLLPGTIAENLDVSTQARSSARDDHDRQLAVLQAVGLDELRGSDQLLEVVSGARGLRLSGGQRQRLAVARALARDADVLVLVDPTSALDSITEARVADAITTYRDRRCSVIVTTSPTMLGRCDRVAFVDGADLVDVRDHESLVRNSEAYRALVGVSS